MIIISTKNIILLFIALLSFMTATVMLGFKEDIFNRIISWVNIEKLWIIKKINKYEILILSKWL